MVGGLEKWVVEKRSVAGLRIRRLEDLRAIPDYKNRNTLLDTSTVRNLVQEADAIIVDIRYPNDFAQQHIPGAII